MHYELQ